MIAVSQSGETIDTLEALKYAKRQGAKCLSVINVKGSSIARESDYVLYTAAGPEIAVASTKAYTTQLSVDDLMKAGHDGTLEEVFGTGTAAVISPVGELRYKDDVVTVNNFEIGELTQKLYDTLTGIQWGRIPDKYGWTVEVK